MQVAIRPGKPFTFALDEKSATPFFGLAGNPVSTLVGFELFVRPALRLLSGQRDIDRPRLSMVLDCDVERAPDGKLHLVHGVCRVHDDGRLHVESLADAVPTCSSRSRIPIASCSRPTGPHFPPVTS